MFDLFCLYMIGEHEKYVAYDRVNKMRKKRDE